MSQATRLTAKNCPVLARIQPIVTDRVYSRACEVANTLGTKHAAMVTSLYLFGAEDWQLTVTAAYFRNGGDLKAMYEAARPANDTKG